jgi:hypothetical protein
MKKYRITESQLKKVFESIERSKIKEADNYNYPQGADADPNAPWHEEDTMTEPKMVDGPFKSIMTSGVSEFLFQISSNNGFVYTLQDTFDDMYETLAEYLSVPLEKNYDTDEDGSRPYMANAKNWRKNITPDELASALENYMNDLYVQKTFNAATNLNDWESGKYQFMLITKENYQEMSKDIYDDNIKQKITLSFNKEL